MKNLVARSGIFDVVGIRTIRGHVHIIDENCFSGKDMVLCLIFCYNSKNFMGIEDLPVLGKEPDFKPTQEEIQNARQNLGKELPLHLERKMKHRQMKMNNLLEDPAIARQLSNPLLEHMMSVLGGQEGTRLVQKLRNAQAKNN